MGRTATPNIMDEILAAKPAPKPTYVKTTSIRRDGGMQPRASLNWEYVKELMAAIEDGAKLPPVDVTYDGAVYWLWDGYHRWQAHNDLGLLDIAAVIHQGDQVSAQWASFGTNQAHGLRRSNEDKERAARAALKHPLAATLSNREIARHLGIDEKTVRKYREDMTATAEIPQSTTRTGADGRTINTANIGQNHGNAPRNDLTEEETQAFLRRYFHASTLAIFAQAPDPREAVRRHMVKQGGGYWGNDWRYDTRSGKVEVWDIVHHGEVRISRDPVRYREPDAIFTYERLAKLAMDLLPPSILAQQPATPTRTLMEVFVTPEEQEIAAGEAAADEAERQVLAERTDATLWLPSDLRQAGYTSYHIFRNKALYAIAIVAPNGFTSGELTNTDMSADALVWARAHLAISRAAALESEPALPNGLVDASDQLRPELRRAGYTLWARYEDGTMVAAGASYPTQFGNNSTGGQASSLADSIEWCESAYARRQLAIVPAPDNSEVSQAARPITPAAPLPIAIKPVAALVDGPPLPDWAAGELVPVSQRNDYDSDEWYTPAEYIEAARAVMGSIDLDPASSDLAQTIVQAKCHLTKTENGLAMARWLAQTVWLNPPYSNPAVWVAKLVAEHQAGPFVTQAIVLVNNATDTAWFQSLLERYPICLPAKRLAFWRHDQSGLTARQGQAFFYLGPNVAEFTAIFGQFGPVLRRLT